MVRGCINKCRPSCRDNMRKLFRVIIRLPWSHESNTGNVGLSDLRTYNAFGRNRVWAAKSQELNLYLKCSLLHVLVTSFQNWQAMSNQSNGQSCSFNADSCRCSDLSVYANGNISQFSGARFESRLKLVGHTRFKVRLRGYPKGRGSHDEAMAYGRTSPFQSFHGWSARNILKCIEMYWNVLKCTEICWNRSTPHNYNQLCQSAKAGFLDISWIITTYIVIILRLELPWRTWKWWHICGNWMFAMKMFSWTIRATLPCNVHLQQYVYYISLYTIFTMLIYIYTTRKSKTQYIIYIPINCYMQRYSERICKELL
jgi:hypothetical protein